MLLATHALWFRAVYKGMSLDDAYISYRYADNLARGAGLIFNAGERVEGYTNFLWVVLLSAFVRPFGDLKLPSQIVGVACTLLNLGMCAYALRRLFHLAHPLADAALALLVAGSGYVAAWSVGGLEGAFFGLLLTGAWLSYWIEIERPGRRFPISALLFAAVALTRAEGVFIGLGAAIVHLFLRLRRGERFVAWGTLLFPVVGRRDRSVRSGGAYYGPHLFLNSVRVKIGGVSTTFCVGSRILGFPRALRTAAEPGPARGMWRRPSLPAASLFVGYILFVASGAMTSGDCLHPCCRWGRWC
jgi:hypothetical protein